MFLLELHYLPALTTALTSLLSVLLLLAVSRQLWTLGWSVSRDRGNKLPLPKGSMGWPLLGETLHWMVQGSSFHASRREKYGNVFKTHLLGRPVIRVTGAENIRKILLGEHSLVSAQWPHSTRILLGTNTLANSIGELHRHRRRELKESATELLFGGHDTTASTATSLVTFLALHPEVLQKVRGELQEQGLLSSDSAENKQITIELLEQLKYTGSVIKETLRLSPPVPGGFRVALKTFVLNGYQIPKGWNVIYSICDTHDVATNFSKKDEFNPDRFMDGCSEKDACRFSYIPFGGGSRSCVGKEFAKILLKIFTMELARACDWELLNGPPMMKTNPTVYPVDNLPTKFTPFRNKM
ncbi:cytochrome P450 26A1-like [Scyliorhinus canicula]|uniref:cytochrome P450 26A1-like n=1 Tax=Scyliorhinus canicula TaxID=7830 RepID=UPI0018F32F65|nr:cytochrome P450 26A1-like [Scyliorhinus canicula]